MISQSMMCYLTCLKEIPMTKLHNNMISELKKRGNMKEYKDEFLAAPTEIKFLLYFAKMTKKDKNKLYHFLKDANNPPLYIVAGDLFWRQNTQSMGVTLKSWQSI